MGESRPERFSLLLARPNIRSSAPNRPRTLFNQTMLSHEQEGSHIQKSAYDPWLLIFFGGDVEGKLNGWRKVMAIYV